MCPARKPRRAGKNCLQLDFLLYITCFEGRRPAAVHRGARKARPVSGAPAAAAQQRIAVKAQNTITFIVSRNYGRSLAWTAPAWQVYAVAALLVLALAGMAGLSLLYAVAYPRMDELQRQRDELRQERDLLQERLGSQYQRQYERRENPVPSLVEGEGGGPPRFVTLDGGDQDLYEPPIRVASLTTRVNGRDMEVAFRLVNVGDPENNRGGYLFAILENAEVSPPRYEPSPAVKLTGEGFPQLYKAGVRFTRIRHAVTFRRRLHRESTETYFTHATVFLFSVRGGIILKERFELERDLFFSDGPAVRTQHRNQA